MFEASMVVQNVVVAVAHADVMTSTFETGQSVTVAGQCVRVVVVV